MSRRADPIPLQPDPWHGVIVGYARQRRPRLHLLRRAALMAALAVLVALLAGLPLLLARAIGIYLWGAV